MASRVSPIKGFASSVLKVVSHSYREKAKITMPLLLIANSKLFREYIGAESDSIKLSDVPINSNVEFHFILAFVVDYTYDNHTSPTNGEFNIFWETDNLGPCQIASIKDSNSNVKIAVSLGGDSVGDECIGQLITSLKRSGTISFASIAPYEDDTVKSHYLALWRKYGQVIDYVNFQFYAYDKVSVPQFITNFKMQASNYGGGQLLASFQSDGGGGLRPSDGYFEACNELKDQGKLGGIFIWCADESKGNKFQYEKKSQDLHAA
ncbi:hypothetical protein QQP08_026485 [Theobroma cacao]|nr:hypothetical protein QQP08_026485 [Theobroma cacao]